MGGQRQGAGLVWGRRDGGLRRHPPGRPDLRVAKGSAGMGELKLRPVPTPTGRAAGPTPLNALGDNVLTTTLDKVINWGRSSAIWPALFGLACCAIEMMGTGGPRHDLSRFGSELFRASPRQADLMIVSGRVSMKMDRVLRQIYGPMPGPKWVIAMGA